jgi:hypothetical protein
MKFQVLAAVVVSSLLMAPSAFAEGFGHRYGERERVEFRHEGREFGPRGEHEAGSTRAGGSRALIASSGATSASSAGRMSATSGGAGGS